MSKMNQEIKAQWTAALRSGEFKQGRKALNQDGKLCCLGVLCELAVKAGAIEADVQDGTTFYDGDMSILPRKVQEWAGISNNEPQNPEVATENHGIMSLAELNDGQEDPGYSDHREPYTFDQIADLIDAQL